MWPHWPQQQPRPLIQWPQRFQLAERRVPRVHPPVVRQIGQIMVELIVRRVLLSSRGRMTSPASATRITKSTLAQVIYKQKLDTLVMVFEDASICLKNWFQVLQTV